jgi:nicotinamide riboside kinase
MKVVNLIGGANTGKSTAAFGLMYRMKRWGLNVEYAGEYARDMVLEERSNILRDQLYILAKQNRKLQRLKDIDVSWVVTDTCLLLGTAYNYQKDPALEALTKEYFSRYNNVTFYLPRNYNFLYHTEGRSQKSHEEAAEIDTKIEAILPDDTIRLEVSNNRDYVTQILNHLGFFFGMDV